MISKVNCAIPLLFLVSLSFALYSTTPTLATHDQKIFLKYEVNDVYVETIKHVIKISNFHFASVTDGKLFVPIIRNETNSHYVILYNVSSSNGTPLTIEKDDSGNIYACWDNINIKGQGTFQVELDYHVFSFSLHYTVNSSLITDYDNTSDMYRKYTQPEDLIESTNPEIVSEAENLTRNVSDFHEKVLKIYEFVKSHIHYVIQPEERGALWALKNETGDCSEYSYLFVALCRAAGIPARVQAGFAFHSFSETLKDGHMWAEYYLGNYGWVPVDVTWGLLDAIDGHHFSSIQSVPEIIPYANYVFNYTSGPEEKYVKDEQLVSTKPCSVSIFNDSFVENIVKTVSKLRQAKFTVLMGKIFGAFALFPSEAKEVDWALLESEVQLQNAMSSWEESPKIARSEAINTFEKAEKVVQDAWLLIVKTLTVFISIPVIILLVASILLLKRQHQTQQKRESCNRSFIYVKFLIKLRRKPP